MDSTTEERAQLITESWNQSLKTLTELSQVGTQEIRLEASSILLGLMQTTLELQQVGRPAPWTPGA